MILYWGDPATINTKQWYVMELRSERTAEEILKRVLQALKPTFRDEAVEVFVPEERTRENSFALLTENYVFVRSDNSAKVGKLRKVTGVQGMVSKDDSARVSSFLKVDDDYVQSLMEKVHEARIRRGAAIKDGSWVRVLDGWDRDLYGHVQSVAGDRAVVRIDLKTKLWFVETSIYNLLDCSDIEPRFRVFYYGPSVERMIDEDPDHAAEMLKDDLFHDESAVQAWLYGSDSEAKPTPVPQEAAAKTSRERTPSRFVRSLIQTGEHDVRKLLLLMVDAIRQGHLRCPQTTTILWHVIRTEMLRHAFPDETFKNYTDLVNRKGEQYRLVPADVEKAFPELVEREAQNRREAFLTAELKHSRPTITAYVRAHLKSGDRNLLDLVRQVMSEFSGGGLKAPKHVDSMVRTIRRTVLSFFRQTYPSANYAQIVEKEGSGLILAASTVCERFPKLEGIIQTARAAQLARIASIKSHIVVADDFDVLPTPKPQRRLGAVTQIEVPSDF